MPLFLHHAPAPHASPRRAGLAAHGCVVALVLALCALAPRAQHPALLIAPAGAPAALAWARRHHLQAIGQGRPPGSLIVTGGTTMLALDALRGGMLLLAAPAGLCGATSSPAPLSSPSTQPPSART
ncbi:MAG TPA: hypothetical protein VN222_13690 [Novosphingobium sp.]|nr:hypothetical protein [Novosphingobium sp.]